MALPSDTATHPSIDLVRRRTILAGLAAVAGATPSAPARAATAFAAIPMATHERGMRLAIAEAMKNPRFPFGAVIVRAGTETVLGNGVNNFRGNPVLHGEIACINDYVARNGNTGWDDVVLYTTAEPCAMCMSALVWSGIGGVVFASSLATVMHWGRGEYGIDIPARAVVEASRGYNGTLLGGVLAAETDALFAKAGALD
ncbi:nucleoside deaminase [Limobrevibacterium gyesilva]|uniref:Nucleoside deaminase n=1 Tax=Limobrevibacterium gyesilva TaxID=2991712 RepID=A0AA42CHI4_9PROT|nr:nucleoside deaminase [Limobrevibacterium gyesilva]MCW3477286.1 nucleoside deaminase [Limobrevibacterium gyesilva]